VALARALAARRPLLVVDGELDPTIWALLPAVVAQAAWIEGLLLAATSAAAVARLGEDGSLKVALVGNDRVVAQGRLADLEPSTDPDVRSVLTWVSGGGGDGRP
jgi:ABC-type transporter Mla maintaining outer membrane lipid asymmetry ATPase subunit MlaF